MFKRVFQIITRPRRQYQPLVEILVSESALRNNFLKFKTAHPKLQFAPVLKSNAYGHGLALVAGILDTEHIPFFIVDSYYEALVLRRSGIKSKILVLGYSTTEQIHQSLPGCAFAIISLDQLKALAKELKVRRHFHLKIDTGMNRQGVMLNELKEAIKLAMSNKHIILEGAGTHFADADGNDQSFTKEQVGEWNEVTHILKKQVSTIKYFHAAATSGSYFASETEANVCRLGLGLYGFTTSPHDTISLEPALELRTMVSSVKKISAGEKVGYNITFTADHSMTIATLPLGYNEGVDRRLSNMGVVKIGDTYCPVVGLVSMNITTIDVSAVKDIKPEMPVVVISSNSLDRNSVANIAKVCETIPYEILVHIPGYLRRTVVA